MVSGICGRIVLLYCQGCLRPVCCKSSIQMNRSTCSTCDEMEGYKTPALCCTCSTCEVFLIGKFSWNLIQASYRFSGPEIFEWKGVRYGDTGLSAASYCFRKKICGGRTAQICGRYRIIPQAFCNKFRLGHSRYLDGGSGYNACVAVPSGDASRRLDAACSAASDPFLTLLAAVLCRLVQRLPGLLYALLRSIRA